MQPLFSRSRRQALTQAAAGALALLGVSAKAQMLVPFSPTQRIQRVFETINEWVEVYALDRKQWPAALDALMAGQAPEPLALAYVMDSHLHLHWAGSAREWIEQSSLSTRDGQPVVYDDPCTVYPLPGDREVWRFGGPGALGAVFELEILRYLPFAIHPLTGAMRILDPSNASECAQQQGARIFLGGTLRVILRGQTRERRSVLVQSIYEP